RYPRQCAGGPLDQPVRGELDEILRLVLVEIVVLHEPELDRGRRHALLEFLGIEREPVAQEIAHVVLARRVIRLDRHATKDRPPFDDRLPRVRAAHGAHFSAPAFAVRRKRPIASVPWLGPWTGRSNRALTTQPARSLRRLGSARRPRACSSGAATTIPTRRLRSSKERCPATTRPPRSRFEEGYGVQRETLARLAEEGCGLVLTVDCGVTAVEEIAESRARG